MKLIRQVSTGKIIYRENPYTDNTLANASSCSGIDVSDLQMVDENYSEVDWANALQSEKSWEDRRKSEYPTIEECVHAILDGELDDLQIKRQAVKEKYPKEI